MSRSLQIASCCCFPFLVIQCEVIGVESGDFHILLFVPPLLDSFGMFSEMYISWASITTDSSFLEVGLWNLHLK